MMNTDPEQVRSTIDSILSDMSDHLWLFTSNPGHDFMRQHLGKLSFRDTMRLILSMGKETLSDELVRYFDMDVDCIPSPSAFVQRRRQILPSAFQYLFHVFSTSFPQTTHRFKDRCILACDGTHVVYTTNSEIIEDYNKPRMEDHKGYNHMHLNALVDVISRKLVPGTIKKVLIIYDIFHINIIGSGTNVFNSFTFMRKHHLVVNTNVTPLFFA